MENHRKVSPIMSYSANPESLMIETAIKEYTYYDVIFSKSGISYNGLCYKGISYNVIFSKSRFSYNGNCYKGISHKVNICEPKIRGDTWQILAYCPDCNGLEGRKLVLAGLDLLGKEEVGFGQNIIAWKRKSPFWPKWNGLEWRKAFFVELVYFKK
jgi:hypothetical protein